MIKRGDLLFRQGKYHHTMIVSDPLNFSDPNRLIKKEASQNIEVIHAASIDSGVYRELIDIDASEKSGESFTFYRHVDPRLNNAVEYAKLWAWHRSPTTKVTRGGSRVPQTLYSYGQETPSGADESRYAGVLPWRFSTNCPPFQFDALYRSFKWAEGMRSGFSEKRGTTCCAFITACYQASAVDALAKGQYKAVKKGLDILKELRNPKKPLEERRGAHIEVGPKHKKIAHRALREHSNTGGYKNHLFNVDDYCRFVTKEITGKEQTVRQVFPGALIVDAKYNYSANFEKMVSQPSSGFTRIL